MNSPARGLLLLGVFLTSLCGDVSKEVARKSNELNKVRFDIDVTKQTMQRLLQEKNKVQAQLADIETRYGEVAARVKALNATVQEKQRTLQGIAEQLGKEQSEFARQRFLLIGQVRAAYALGQTQRLKLLLNQQQIAPASRVLVYYRYLHNAHLNTRRATEQAKEQLTRLHESQQLETALLKQTSQQEQDQQTLLTSIKKERDALLVQLSQEVSSHQQHLSRLKDSEGKLQNLIASLQSQEQVQHLAKQQESPAPNAGLSRLIPHDLPFSGVFTPPVNDFTTLKGKLLLPVNGQLAQKFGSPRSEEGAWDGIVINANEGAEIHAVEQGTVAFADWLRGYGLLIIIDHGHDYMSLYAFNQSLYKKIGEHVDVGEVIASVGQSGGRSQASLYFGLRKKGVPLNPLEWCKN